MSRASSLVSAFVPFVGAMHAGSVAAEAEKLSEPAISMTATGYYYAMRDEPDFGVGVASLNRGPVHLEGRYNYEAKNSGSLFAGWKFAGGDEIAFECTPMAGALFGAARGVIPGLEAAISWRSFDAYIEAEYVDDLAVRSDSYYYSWSELGWKPVEWLRIGLAGQRTHVVQSGREFQRGAFVQVTIDRATLGVYAFNPDSESRYLIVALGIQFQ